MLHHGPPMAQAQDMNALAPQSGANSGQDGDTDMMDGVGSMTNLGSLPAQLYRTSSTPRSNDSNTAMNTPDGSTPQSSSKPVIGAGPLPAGYGTSSGPGTGSTLTEFTKRRNWSRLILEELRDLLIILSPDGRMQHISPSSLLLTGHEHNSLKSRFLVEYVHQQDQSMFRRELNESIASQNQMRFFYRFRKADETYCIFEAFGHPHFSTEVLNKLGVSENARYCRGVFMISRPYPTKNAQLLDSFLEHKIENERLLRKIEELKREEQVELEQQDQLYSAKDGTSAVSVSDDQRWETKTETGTNLDGAASSYDGMPPPPKPTISNTALTRQNLNDALAASRPDSINDKMARYEGATPTEHIEMLTGLRNGERSEGISTGAFSPALIKGDAGIAILADRENRSNEKKKKLKLADEYVCTDCGTLDSPEWRKGPSGPKTLCNACGLRWAKKEKKKSVTGSSAHSQAAMSK